MSPTPGISSVARPDWQPLAAALARAFEHDPQFTWLVPDPARRAQALRAHFEVECRDVALGHGLSLAVPDETGGGFAAAALILPPGEWRMPARVQARRFAHYARGFGTRLPRAMALGAAIERRHLREPHLYLAYIGAVPEARGRGLGGALLAPLAERCDREGLPAYLEASSPRSAPLYRRFGFETVETIAPFGAPPIELMVRRPA